MSVRGQSPSAAVVDLSQPGIKVHATAWNQIEIRDGEGKLLMTLGNFKLLWKPRITPTGGIVRRISTPEGLPGFEVTYLHAGGNDPKPIGIVGRFIARPFAVEVEYTVTNVPAGSDLGGCMFDRVLPAGAQDLGVTKLGLWERDPAGGLPIESPDGILVRYKVGDKQMCLAFGPENKANPNWASAWSHHTRMSSAGAGEFKTNFSVLVGPAEWPAAALAASWHGRPIGLSLSTERTYNWWTWREGMSIGLDAVLFNSSTATREVRVRHWVRDFSGTVVSQDDRKIALHPFELRRQTIPVKPGRSRELFFAEIAATDVQTGREVFARTNLAVLPDYEFKAGPEESICGVAAYWPIPTEEDVQRLMDRMGVRWLRSGDTRRQHPPRIAIHQATFDLNKPCTPAERDEWIEKNLRGCVERKNPAWEFGNEYNMSTAGIAQEGEGIGKAALAERYVEWIQAIRRVQKETGTQNVKLLSFGVAGMDEVFWRRIYELGGWPCLDGLCLHPGRGNVTADYPEAADQWKMGARESYWNFYGSVRRAKQIIGQYGEPKPLYLTEVYTSGFPNRFWEDTPRNAAENAVLQLTLAKAEGVKAAFWYQMFDSVWYDKLGVNPKEREYYFGLLNRDLSFKPCMMGYIAAAEALDQARFVRWLKFSDAHNRGLLFETPRGAMAVIWNRADGYVLTQNTQPYASPEPWNDTWKTKTPVELPAKGKTVKLVNCIGQQTAVEVENGRARVILDGAPLVVYGIDENAFQ